MYKISLMDGKENSNTKDGASGSEWQEGQKMKQKIFRDTAQAR